MKELVTRLIEKIQQQLHKITKRQILFFLLAMALVVANGYAIIREFPAIQLITVGLVGLYVVFFHADWAMYLVALSTPFSVIIRSKNIPLGLSLPSEALMILVTMIFLARILYDLSIDRKFLRHPISIAILVYLGWMLLTSLTSVRPVVSIKFFASKVWFITSCYWFFMQMANDGLRNAVRYFNCYAIGLSIIVLITTYQHALSGFDEHYAHFVMSPFYNDHTAYGAALAFMLPVSVGFLFLPGNRWPQRTFYIVVSLILLMGFYLSFSRAAWLSLVVAVGVLVILKLRIKLSWIIGGGLVVGLLLFFYADDILYKMSRNNQDSSGNFVEHIQSMSNISTDASNMERINRWTAAFGMIRERPVFGWGPGTYQFEYAPFQQGYYRTIISTDFGDGGNAHSEYIGPCAETGFPGALTVVAIVITFLICGIRTYIYAEDKTLKTLSLCMTLALITYFTHGFLNNFLDTDKLSVIVWAAMAVLTVCDVKLKTKTLNC
ncbi:MAG: O-antigen ligase family protein [Bacteroidales bacterium]|nr:O-antigen ligase family protein [Bacteroidales bacterium]